MSHVATMKPKAGEPIFQNIEALKMAAQICGGEIVEQSSYRWFGYSVGDYPLPAGITGELGNNATFVFRIRPENYAEFGVNPTRTGEQPYEIGFVPDPVNPGSFIPLYDFFAGGFGLDAAVGEPIYVNGKKGGEVQTLCPKLIMHYQRCVDSLVAQANGDDISFMTLKRASELYPDLVPPSNDENTFVSITNTDHRVRAAN
jgi:hypothetical protein